MADNVQYIMDRMAVVFNHLTESKLFSDIEVKSIIQKRTNFEYMMQRRVLTMKDIQSYIDYELKLFELRNLRANEILIKINSTKEMKTLLRKIHGSHIKHICYIYERATRRFMNDIEIWNDFIEFLKDNKSTNYLNGVYGKALSIHPKNEIFWIDAATFELNTNGNSHAARVLLHRALRVNKFSRNLWLKYFELECFYILKISARKTFLGIEDEDTKNAALLLEAPMIIFTHAIESIPNDASFAFSFYRISLDMQAQPLITRIESTMRLAFHSDPSFWRLLAISNLSPITYILSSSNSSILKQHSLSSLMLTCSIAASNAINSIDEYLNQSSSSSSSSVVEVVLVEVCTNLLAVTARLPLLFPHGGPWSPPPLSSALNKAAFIAIAAPTTRDHSMLLARLLIWRSAKALCLDVSSMNACSPVAIADALPSYLASVHSSKLPAINIIDAVAINTRDILLNLVRISLADAAFISTETILSLISDTIALAVDFCRTDLGCELIALCIDTLLAMSSEGCAEISSCENFTSIIKTIESVISSRHCSQTFRVRWCCRYLLLIAASSKDIKQAFEYVETLIKSKPQLLMDMDLGAFYHELINLLYCQDSEKDYVFIMQVVRSAMDKGLEDAGFTDLYVKLLRDQGDHRLADHTVWWSQKNCDASLL